MLMHLIEFFAVLVLFWWAIPALIAIVVILFFILWALFVLIASTFAGWGWHRSYKNGRTSLTLVSPKDKRHPKNGG